MDSTAIALCKDNGIPIVVFNLFEAGNIARATLLASPLVQRLCYLAQRRAVEA